MCSMDCLYFRYTCPLTPQVQVLVSCDMAKVEGFLKGRCQQTV